MTTAEAATTEHLIHCLKCKKKTESKDLTPVTMSNGRDAVSAVCVECGTKKRRIGKMAGVTPD